MKEVEKEFVKTGQARLVYRYLVVVGPESAVAAEAAECAADQGQFFPYHDLLYQNQGPENAGYLTNERLTDFAEELGMVKEEFSTCLDSGKYRSKVRRSTEQALSFGIRSTPTVLVNGRLVRNPLDLKELRRVILEELKAR